GALHDLVDGARVVILDATAQGVSEHLFGEVANEVLIASLEDRLEFLGTAEALAGGENARGVDGVFAVLLAPGADGVAVFTAEAERVHSGVARGRGSIGAVLLDLLAERAREFAVAVELGDVGRGWRRRRAEDLFEDPLPTLHRRGAGGVGRDREDAGL